MIKGFLLVDKGKGLTSFDVVHKIRKWSNERRVGHAGTLDPLATGLLIVAIGEATKFLEYLVGCDKEYEVLARFGVVSETYDAEGPLSVMSAEKFAKVSKKDLPAGRQDLEKVIRECFLGEIDQVPPKYSALKIKGKKAADLMRKGLDVEMKSRKVKIYDFKVLNFSWPEIKFSVKCGSGTYIRSLIHDLGQKIGCGAYVLELRRTMIDEYKVDGRDVVTASRDQDFVGKNIEQYLVSIESFVERFDSINLTDREFVDLSNGKVVLSNKVVRSVPTVALYKGKVVGIIENALNDSGLKFRKRIH